MASTPIGLPAVRRTFATGTRRAWITGGLVVLFVLSWSSGFIEAKLGSGQAPTANFWLATAWLVVLPTFGGYGLYWLLVERIGVPSVNGLLFLVAPVTAVWGAAMFGEPLGVATVLGLALALAAAVVVGRATGRRDGTP